MAKIKVKILKNDQEIYKGNILDLPFKKEFVVKRSIEIFDDEDPCIIHQSYVVKLFVDELLKLTNLAKDKEVKLTPYVDDLNFLDLDINDAVIYLEGK